MTDKKIKFKEKVKGYVSENKDKIISTVLDYTFVCSLTCAAYNFGKYVGATEMNDYWTFSLIRALSKPTDEQI